MRHIEPCAVHDGYTDSDCDFCSTEIQELSNDLQNMVNKNNMLTTELAHSGGEINPVMWQALRLDMLIQLVLKDPKLRFGFERAFCENAHGLLDEAKTQVNRARLTANGNTPINIKRVK